ncbi:uncharacterized protein LOC123445348 [Hordeum vulgare subsp. vulgare]|uniref:Uncharacterized protein n=1 Tax=Hordeum vulgare subsp. vulgare TaxID=112509 RepID=A0A287MG15_HORVV|nr:uncharacterized protein LOC123445348 [Hordeum vulgare subsp. vulgare]
MAFPTQPVTLTCLTLVAVLLIAMAADKDSTASGHIDCGESSQNIDDSGRTWDGDADSKFAPSVKGVAATAHFNVFNVSQTAQDISFAYLVREFSVNVSSGSLDLIFAPSAHRNGSYALVSGIEIVPISTSEWFLCICEWH